MSAPEDRDWFTELGNGLVVVWPPAPAGSWPASGGAWLHVAASGTVTAFTGKVDVGQDNSTALRLLVAEELAVDPADVRLVQGDTDLCPYDAGTFGSRSMPDVGEALRRAAAGAREALVALAAPLLGGGPHACLSAGQGSVSCGLTGTRLPYGGLVVGLRHVEVLVKEPPLTSPSDWITAGRPYPAPRGDAVTGARQFVSDLRGPGLRHGAVLRPPASGAVLRSVDTAPAEAMPGVTVVRDGEFIGVTAERPGGRAASRERDQARLGRASGRSRGPGSLLARPSGRGRRMAARHQLAGR